MPTDDVKIDVDNDEKPNNTAPPPQALEKSQSSRSSMSEYALGAFWEEPPAYHDHAGQAARTKTDNHGHSRGARHWLKTMMRSKSIAWQPILLSVAWSTLAVYLSQLASRGFRTGECRFFCSRIALDATTHSYVGFALFLLLGFRVNESYQRYLDGLKIWTNIAGTIGSTAKYFMQAFRPGEFHSGDRERMLGWLVAFPVALKRELREERDLSELKAVLAPEDLAELQNAPSMSAHTLFILSAYIIKAKDKENKLPQTFLVHLINWIATLAGCADKCMQIKTMPCAFSYVAHLRAFLLLWLILLPFTLVETMAWGTPGVVAFITFGIVGVELNAQELEDPFGRDYNDIPLGAICERIMDATKDTYKISRAPVKKYVHATRPVQPEPGETFWLEPETNNKKE